MAGPIDTTAISGELTPELAPVFEPGTPAFKPEAAAAGDDLGLGDILTDALFGEVIDISDLIPRALSPSSEVFAAELPTVGTAAAMEFGMQEGSDVFASHSAALTILYVDGILALDATIL